MSAPTSVASRLAAKSRVDENGCWIWQLALDADGYGQIDWHGVRARHAHRASYEAHFGEMPSGLQVDHLCRVRSCINPAHLEAVTPAENSRRRVVAPKTHCANGHEFTPSNTNVNNGYRRCRACNRAAAARLAARRNTALNRQESTR